jgi:hypothetical protein
MLLNVADHIRIDDPTAEQLGHHLRHLAAEAPFLVLDADVGHYIQATPAASGLRVEWRHEADHRFMVVDVERAEAAFAAFRRSDEPTLRSFPWRRLHAFNDPHRLMLLCAVAALAIATAIVLSVIL